MHALALTCRSNHCFCLVEVLSGVLNPNVDHSAARESFSVLSAAAYPSRCVPSSQGHVRQLRSCRIFAVRGWLQVLLDDLLVLDDPEYKLGQRGERARGRGQGVEQLRRQLRRDGLLGCQTRERGLGRTVHV